MENKTQLLKLGNDIVFGNSGVVYSMEPGTVYVPTIDAYTDEIKLNIVSDLMLPKKVYSPNSDVKFINKVLNSYSKMDKTMGILLAGEKGAGKTVMAKNIAVQSNLPILTIDKTFRPRYLKGLFDKIKDTPMCVIFDEFDKLGKDYDSDYMLQVFDGISSCGNHLIILTCNDTDEVNSYMLDRCGRIRYYREFEEMNPSMVKEILNDKIDHPAKIDDLVDFVVSKFGLKSFDNVASFADEVNLYPDEDLDELFNDMNISTND